jgi:hypothetical protein
MAKPPSLHGAMEVNVHRRNIFSVICEKNDIKKAAIICRFLVA